MNISLGLIPIRYNLIVFLTRKLYLLQILRASCAKRGGRLEIEIERAFRNAQYGPDQTRPSGKSLDITLHYTSITYLFSQGYRGCGCAPSCFLSLSLSSPCYMCALTIVGILEKNVQLHTYICTHTYICAKKLRMAHTQAQALAHTYANRHPVCTIPIGNTFKKLCL